MNNKEKQKQKIHYYTDGGKRGTKTISAFIKKGYFVGSSQTVRSSYRNRTNIDAETRAIKLVQEDVKKNHYNTKDVIIHTDQKALCFNNIRNNHYNDLRDELNKQGFTIRYIKSTHSDNNDNINMNALAIHQLVQTKLNEPKNRYLVHKTKQKR